METVYDADPEALIHRVAERLEQDFDAVEMPDWARYVKTGLHKERPPQQENWWYIRSAAVLRKIYTDGPLGTQRLRTIYGGKQDRGHKPEHFAKGSGKVIRTILQQLEETGLVEQEENRGRALTAEGQSFLDTVSKNVSA